MKLLLVICFSLFATTAMACTDFTGTYRNEESDVYSLQQSACASITAVSNEGSESIVTDGVYRVTDEDEQVRIQTAASFVAANLTVNIKIEYLVAFPPEIPTEMIPVKVLMVHTKDRAGNIVIVTTALNSAGQVIDSGTTTHQKI